ncbi:hypothetical protein SAMN04488510_10867 [Fervidobacterium changbaicum]|uniref:Uncharacterized protein n=2 Tax=Fervidobacterium TaxID=2422 RepID=A0AAI8GCM2_FERIS|nr:MULTISPECIES: hypothetical protein [Fervidobacterium]AMW32340.2 hypothetical protein NA23_02880 [Fervidobacterium islandicum]QAV32311.1 hypothetical protein CBS1_00185 [Fervidobacterium changbaicum]QAV34074.1 hypothetical protein CBS1_10465 [Fervidobacterium changbaicum]SDH22909.1 hypothetical protein SAMN04488510_10867 [Fervidobacterium changbaicum]
MEELKAIASACITDNRIYEIVYTISRMSEGDLQNFRSKVVGYFMARNSPEDMEAYKFYKIILEDENAKKVLELYEEIKNRKGQ